MKQHPDLIEHLRRYYHMPADISDVWIERNCAHTVGAAALNLKLWFATFSRKLRERIGQ